MLVLTEAAAEVVKSVTSVPQAPDGSGLRITSPSENPAGGNELRLATVPKPDEDDQVIEASGARVFLEPQAAAYLDDKVLDATVDNQGMARFSLALQVPGQA